MAAIWAMEDSTVPATDTQIRASFRRSRAFYGEGAGLDAGGTDIVGDHNLFHILSVPFPYHFHTHPIPILYHFPTKWGVHQLESIQSHPDVSFTFAEVLAAKIGSTGIET